MNTYLLKFSEKVLYGFGFGMGMGFSWKIMNKPPSRIPPRYTLSPNNHVKKPFNTPQKSTIPTYKRMEPPFPIVD